MNWLEHHVTPGKLLAFAIGAWSVCGLWLLSLPDKPEPRQTDLLNIPTVLHVADPDAMGDFLVVRGSCDLTTQSNDQQILEAHLYCEEES